MVNVYVNNINTMIKKMHGGSVMTGKHADAFMKANTPSDVMSYKEHQKKKKSFLSRIDSFGKYKEGLTKAINNKKK